MPLTSLFTCLKCVLARACILYECLHVWLRLLANLFLCLCDLCNALKLILVHLSNSLELGQNLFYQGRPEYFTSHLTAMFRPGAISVTFSNTTHQTIISITVHPLCPGLCCCGCAKPNCANVFNHKAAFHLVSFVPTDLLKTM